MKCGWKTGCNTNLVVPKRNDFINRMITLCRIRNCNCGSATNSSGACHTRHTSASTHTAHKSRYKSIREAIYALSSSRSSLHKTHLFKASKQQKNKKIKERNITRKQREFLSHDEWKRILIMFATFGLLRLHLQRGYRNYSFLYALHCATYIILNDIMMKTWK